MSLLRPSRRGTSILLLTLGLVSLVGVATTVAIQPSAARELIGYLLHAAYASGVLVPAADNLEFGPEIPHDPSVAQDFLTSAQQLLPDWELEVTGSHSRAETDPSLGFGPSDLEPLFFHEDLSSPRLGPFRGEAEGLLAAADVFELSAALRSLTRHGPVAANTWGTDPLTYLRKAKEGVPMTCRYFAVMDVALAAQKGYTSRLVGLSKSGKSLDHAVVELYSPEEQKWILLDPDFNIAYRQGAVWLNAYELQQIWKQHGGRLDGEDRDPENLVELVVLGEAGSQLRESNLSQSTMNLELFEYVTYSIRNDYLSREYSWGHPARWVQFLLRADLDGPWPAICRECLEVRDPEVLYWPVGRTEIALEGATDNPPTLVVRLGTWTPNFAYFEVRINDEPWRQILDDRLVWRFEPGRNRLVVRSVNAAGLAGESNQLEFVARPGS